jgi:hypothetical protein
MRRFGPRWSVAGWSLGLLVGAIAVLAARLAPALNPMNLPLLLLIGLGWAAFMGAYLGGRVAPASRRAAVGWAIVMGVAVAALTAASVVPVPPFVLVAIAVSPTAWPVTLPAAAAWVALLRWTKLRTLMERPTGVLVAAAMSFALLVWRFQAPLVLGSIERELCASYPGERIVATAWSPGGRWLAFASERGYTVETVRLLDVTTGAISTVDSGSALAAGLGLAVDDRGTLSYQVGGVPIAGSFDTGTALQSAPIGAAAVRVGSLPGVVTLVGTRDGLVGIVEIYRPPGRRAAWIRPSERGVELVDLTPDELARNPEAGIALAAYDGSFTVQLSTGRRSVPMPVAATSSISITPDHRHLVFVEPVMVNGSATGFRLVAESLESGERISLVEDRPAFDARIAGGRLAYLGSWGEENSLCITRLDLALGL